MQYSNIPANKLSVAFANSAGGGYITVPLPVTPTGTGRASFAEGFPPLDFTPLSAGGSPPYGQDLNGILNMISAWTVWKCAGGMVKYDSAYSTTIGGYPKGALLLSSASANLLWLNTADNNTTDPDGGSPANWSPISAGTVLFPDGAASAPGAAFATQTNMGLYKVSSSSFGMSVGGVLRVTLTSNSITSTVPYFASDGTATAPSVSFATDPDTGLYSHAANTIGFTTAGVVRVTIGTSVNSTVPYYAPNGSAATPSYGFATASTGFYSAGANEVDIALSGTLTYQFSNTAFTSTKQIKGYAGDATTPTYGSATDSTTGMNLSAGLIGLGTSGVVRRLISTTSEQSTLQQQSADGSAAAPTYSFSSDTDTGMYRIGANQIGWSTNGTQRLTLDGSGNLSATGAMSEGGTLLSDKYLLKSRVFVSSQQTISGFPSSEISVAHGLGSVPTSISAFLVCQVADNGFAVGDMCPVALYPNNPGNSLMADATNIKLRMNVATNTNPTTSGTAFNMTASRWKAVLIARLDV